MNYGCNQTSQSYGDVFPDADGVDGDRGLAVLGSGGAVGVADPFLRQGKLKFGLYTN